MKKKSFLWLAIFELTFCWADTVSETRQALDRVTGRLDMRQNWTGVYWDYGILYSTNTEYRALANTVSNQWRSVLDNLPRCATNQLERLLVLGVCDQFDEAFFFDYVERVFDLWRTGAVSKAEMNWCRYSERQDFYHLFARRYNVERVRSLVTRFRDAEPDGAQWQKILSGEAYTNYMECVQAGMIPPE